MHRLRPGRKGSRKRIGFRWWKEGKRVRKRERWKRKWLEMVGEVGKGRE